jgi:hypothetical protein
MIRFARLPEESLQVDSGEAWVPLGPLSGEQLGPDAEREGCDLEPVDPTTDEGRLTLLSYVWPDQAARLARFSARQD